MKRLTQPELLDDRDVDTAELTVNLADIARLNRLTGTTAALCRAVLPLLVNGQTANQQSALIVDVGTGAADFPRMMQNYAKQHGKAVHVIGSDLHSGVLRYVQRTDPGLPIVQLDAVHLPFADRSVDVLTCAQTIHHLPPALIGALLIEFARVSRIGFVVLDLERSRLAAITIHALTLMLSRSRLSRHDGPLSARRAYRGAEFAALAASAGVAVEMRPVFPFRWLAIRSN